MAITAVSRIASPARLHLDLAKMVLNAGQEGSDPLLALKLRPGSAEEFDHRKTAEADVDFFRGKFLRPLRQHDRATEQIVCLLVQLQVGRHLDFGVSQRAGYLVEKILQEKISGVSEVCHKDSPLGNTVQYTTQNSRIPTQKPYAKNPARGFCHL